MQTQRKAQNNSDIFSFVKENVKIEEVAKHLGLQLEKSGHSYQGDCPTGHPSKNGKCFSIESKKQYFQCFHCHTAGDVIRLVEVTKKITAVEAVDWLIEQFMLDTKIGQQKINFKKPTEEQITEFHDKRLKGKLYQTAFEWMKSLLLTPEAEKELLYLTNERKYDRAVIQKSNWCYFPHSNKIKKHLLSIFPEHEKNIQELSLHGFTGERIHLAIPYHNSEGNITGFLKRAAEPEGISFTNSNGKEYKGVRWDSTVGVDKTDLFNLYNCKGEENLLIVEGYPDAVILSAMRVNNIVAVGQGCLSESHLTAMSKNKVKNVTIAFDNDTAGPVNTESAIMLLLEKSDITPYVLEPTELGTHKDPDEFVKAEGIDAFKAILDKVSKGVVWMAEHLLAKYDEKSQIEKQQQIDEVIKLTGLIKNPLDKEEIISIVSKRLKQNKSVIQAMVKGVSKNESATKQGKFWTVTSTGLQISTKDYIDFIIEEGFSKFYLDKDYTFIQIKGNMVKEQSLPQIKDYILSYVEQMEEDESDTKRLLYETLYNHVGQYFNEGLIECIPPREIKFKRDGMDNATVYYKNGFVTLKRNKLAEINPYTKLDSPIWEHMINERSVELIHHKNKIAEYEQFLFNVVGRNMQRFLSLCSAIGYLMHDYKQESNAKAIVLCDQMISDNPNGRTGKSLIGKALEKIKNVERVDGKNFDFKPTFTFQMVKLGTQIIDFNDVKANFDFERLFSVITDGMSIEYKNKTPFTIPFSESPKITISTNYTIKGIGSSYKDRMFEIEFSDHYNPEHKPKDDFGHDFFTGWDDDEWNRFDNFMLECLQLYLDEGLICCELINLSKRKLIDQTSDKFVEFADERVQTNTEFNLACMYGDFKNYIGFENDLFDKCPIKQNTFTTWVRIYAQFNGMVYDKRKSNGSQYVKLIA